MINPGLAFNRIFSDLPPFGGTKMSPSLARSKSILDALGRQYQALSLRLGSRDKMKLDEHLQMIRQLEMSLDASNRTIDGTCVVPGMPGAADSANVAAKGKTMTDLLVASLACGLTNVATMQWADSETKFIMDFPPLMMPDTHHHYQHEDNGLGAFQPD